MASGYAQIHNGAVRSTAALITVEVGFKPRSVLIKGSDGNEAFWNDQMADDSMFKRDDAGAGSLVTSDGIIPTDSGFSIGADADLNPASGASVLHYEAKQ
jgi:hypothetical protein